MFGPKPWLFRVAKVLAGVWLLAALQGCGTFATSHPQEAGAYRQAIATADTAEVLARLGKQSASSDRLLYLLEAGRIQQIDGDFAASRATFARAIEMFAAQDLEAQVRLEHWAAVGGSLLTNDKLLDYRGFGYERIFVHYFQALNYLGLGDAEGAAVEFRRLAYEQQVLEAQHEKTLALARQEARENRIPVQQLQSEHFAGLDRYTADIRSSLLNAQAYVTAAAFWASRQAIDDARIDYLKALQIRPGSRLIETRLARLDADPVQQSPTAQLVILYEEGFVPARVPVGIPLPTLDGGFIALQFPVYALERRSAPVPLQVEVGPAGTVSTELMVDVSKLAAKSLSEQMPMLLLRQTLRGYSKYQLQRQARRMGGGWGQLFASIYNLVSEQADLRSWLTLPNSLQVAQIEVPAGEQQVHLRTPQGLQTWPLRIAAGETRVLRVISTPGRTRIQDLRW